ncbi:MAG: DUF429 domain-containing protein [Actinomycetota bacterium]|nr:DUF429 domain-containing protein [Actinomycetota bacterium]
MTSSGAAAGPGGGVEDQGNEVSSVRTLGVDFASQSKGTVGCWITWSQGLALVGPPIHDIGDETLTSLIREASRTGIDVPFGWPDEFVAELDRHRTFAPWQTPESREDHLFFRATDRHVRAITGQVPLSVSADKIGRTAVRAARVLFELRASGASIDRSGETGKVLEVYPAAALKRWVEGRFRYKHATRGKEELLRLAQTLFARDWLQFTDDCPCGV